MPLYASDQGGSDFKQPEAGTDIARCYSLIDIGTQRGEYLGQPTARRQIVVRFELPNQTDTFEGEVKPLIVSKFYTLSLGEKANLRKDLESWRSKPFTPQELLGFDVTSILGGWCQLSLVPNDKGKVKVAGIMAVPRGFVPPPPYNPIQKFLLDEYTDRAFQELPEGFRKMIEQSDEYRAMMGKAPATAQQRDQAKPSFRDNLNAAAGKLTAHGGQGINAALNADADQRMRGGFGVPADDLKDDIPF